VRQQKLPAGMMLTPMESKLDSQHS